MKSRFVFAAVAMALALVLAPTAHGINKCVDQDGRIAYSDRPCAGAAKASQLDLQAAAPAATAPPAPSREVSPSPLSANLKLLQLCDRGRSGACFQKELIERKCRIAGSERINMAQSECRGYRDDLKTFQTLKNDCRHGQIAVACFTLACAEGDSAACQKRQGGVASSQDKEAVRRQAAREKGLPAGPSWYMSQDWYKHGDGRMTASINCSATTSIGLIRKPPVLERIYTTTTGDQHFVRLEEAAAKGCALATKG